ncbi:cytochrome p450 [Diplodia corticola]|uniref:Cytochrome p450 n=1 Tax=Diplodia corticola TaxID=236234 RepID=A0A1J9QK23_9PEZI|nr:cytochrome p450 [Diplodia corticola]OJD28825.1 cytochrome p450 [Diplodia corticola]
MEGITPEKHRPNLWLASAVAGLAFHAFVQYIDILDVLVWYMLGCFAVAAMGMFYVDVRLYHSTPVDAAKDVVTTATSFTLSLTVSILIYRAFFHRLRRFPGPFAAKLTRLWSVYESSKAFKYHLKLEELHKKHGDVVRIGPRELSITRASALPQIAGCRKPIFYQQADWNRKRVGMLETRDLEDHRNRRKPWEKGLSLTEVAKYDADMQATIGLFLDQIACDRGQRINATQWIAMLTYDLMGVVAFGKDFGSLHATKENPAIKGLRESRRALGVLFPVPWLINMLHNTPGLANAGAMALFRNYCAGLVEEKRATLQSHPESATPPPPNDVMTFLIRAFAAGGPTAAPTLSALHSDGRSLVVAGADTTHSALTAAFYHLAAHPPTYARLQAAMDAACPGDNSGGDNSGGDNSSGGDATTFSHDAAKSVPLLDAVITETLRLHPPLPGGTPRLTPPEGLRLDDSLRIPGDVHVWVPPWVVQRDGRYFERPEEWVPERWMRVEDGGVEGLVRERRAWFTFWVGMFGCAGKQLAYWEMRSVLGRLALRYDIRFASAQDGKDFERDMKAMWTLAPPPLGMCFRERKLRKKI